MHTSRRCFSSGQDTRSTANSISPASFASPSQSLWRKRWPLSSGLPADHLFLRTPELLAPPVADDERMAGVTRDVVAQYLQGVVSEGELRVFADLVSLQIEVGRDKSDRPLRRYDVFESFTTDALVAAGRRALDVVGILAKCLDEGARWGVAQRFKPAYTKAATGNRREQEMPCFYQLVTPEEYWAAARTMATDENEWVVRDTIGGVAELWPSTPQNSTDAAGAAALAEPAHDWIEANFHRGEEQLFDVQSNIDRLRAVCAPFAVRWDELTTAGARPRQ